MHVCLLGDVSEAEPQFLAAFAECLGHVLGHRLAVVHDLTVSTP